MSRVTLRLPEDLHQRLRRQGAQAGASLNDLIVTTLANALEGMDECGKGETGALVEQVQQARVALGAMSVELDVSQLPAALQSGSELPDLCLYRASLPALTPSLSQTIVADRDDRV